MARSHRFRSLKRRLRWLREKVDWVPLLLLSGIFCLMPRSWAHFLGRRLGGVTYACSRRMRGFALENLQQRLGVDGAEARRIARESLRQAGASIAELLRAPRMSERLVRRDIEVPDELAARIEKGGAEGGAVLACAHFGNWELLGLASPFLVGDTIVVARPQGGGLTRRLFDRFRASTGCRIVPADGAVLKCLLQVRKGGIAALVIDLAVPPQAGGHPVNFFGVPTYTTLAAGYLAARTGRPLYLARLEPLRGHRYRLVCDGPVEPEAGLTPREAALGMTERLNALLEQRIRAQPESWGWWLKRWNIRPKGVGGAWPAYSREEVYTLVQATWNAEPPRTEEERARLKEHVGRWYRDVKLEDADTVAERRLTVRDALRRLKDSGEP